MDASSCFSEMTGDTQRYSRYKASAASCYRGIVSLVLLSQLLLLLVLCCSVPGLGINVLHFDGSPEAVGVYHGPINRTRELYSISICVRVFVLSFVGRDPLLSLQDSTNSKTAQIRLELWIDRVRPVLADTWRFQLLPEHLKTNRWYHLCSTYGQHDSTYRTYLDGVLVTYLVSKLGRPVTGNDFILGLALDGGYTLNADMTQANVWDYVLSPEDILEIAQCRTDPQGNYISWNVGFRLRSVPSTEVSLESLCQKSFHVTNMWFPRLTHLESYYICEALGTQLPIPKTSKECGDLEQLSRDTWQDTDTECLHAFITPISDSIKEGEFYRTYDDAPFPGNTSIWAQDEPNGGIYENCVLMSNVGIYDAECVGSQCAVCRFDQPKVYTFKGACEEELRNSFFLAYQRHGLGSLEFIGYGDYNITNVDGVWTWNDKETAIATMVPARMNYPMGRRQWKLTDHRKVCSQRKGERSLLLTPCSDEEFTCDDAACIRLEHRCDLKYDCLDRSDEADCRMVAFPRDYRSDLPPLGLAGTSLTVSMHLLLDTLGVDTSKTQLFATFALQLSWDDSRLLYRNMKIADTLNIVSEKTMFQLWSPEVGFVNTDDNDHSLVDREATMLVQRLTAMSGWNTSSSAEEALFPGRGNHLVLRRKYTSRFVCDFDLNLYPFDVQHCPLQLQLQGASSQYLTFGRDNVSVEYRGNELLIEYQVGEVSLEMGKTNNEPSDVTILITLGRRSGYAILTIYVPSLILLIISYVTLFFRPKIFEVRVMAALTSLLVVATLFTQASSSLPKTSYFKMVDIWLLFCIGVIFLIIICHAFIDDALYNDMIYKDQIEAGLRASQQKKKIKKDILKTIIGGGGGIRKKLDKHKLENEEKNNSQTNANNSTSLPVKQIHVEPYTHRLSDNEDNNNVNNGTNNINYVKRDAESPKDISARLVNEVAEAPNSIPALHQNKQNALLVSNLVTKQDQNASQISNQATEQDQVFCNRSNLAWWSLEQELPNEDKYGRMVYPGEMALMHERVGGRKRGGFIHAETLLLASKIIILVIVAIFNFFYWGYILFG